ncbi:MAG: amidohydrolase family protein [Planctomycetota bacterium]
MLTDGADLVLMGGRIFTGAPSGWFAEALAIRGERILAVGSEQEIQALVSDGTEVVDLAGRVAVPAFVDLQHPPTQLWSKIYFDFAAATNLKEIQERLAAFARDYQIDWLEGGPFDFADLQGKEPHRTLLDKIVPDRAVVLLADGGSSAWLNSVALAKSKITRTTPDPVGGRIARDADGEPSGRLDGTAVRLIARPEAKVADEDVKALLADARQHALHAGLGAVHLTLTEQELSVLATLTDWGEYPLHVFAWPRLNSSGGQLIEALQKQRGKLKDYASLHVLAPLVRVDGMLGGRTAALLEPYADAAPWRGLPLNAAELSGTVKRCNEAGFPVTFQASGDAAVRAALDAIQSVPAAKRLRNVIAQIVLVDAQDVPRFQQLNVVAGFLPGTIPLDLARNGYVDARLGPERAVRALPMRALLDAGAVVAFGSAFDLTPLDPLQWIYGAVTRQDARGAPRDGWGAAQRLSMEEAFRAAAFGGAYAGGQEKDRGTLERGKLADITVLAHDPFAAVPAELLKNRVDIVIHKGKTVLPEGGG